MSGMDIRIDLEGGRREFRGGETVAGAVYLTAREPLESRSLTVELLWRTQGKGNTDSQTIESQLQGAQRWQLGVEHCLPFRFQLPSSPWTYRGHLFNVEYHLTACMDFPWARDTVADEEIVVLPGVAPREEDQEGEHSEQTLVIKSPKKASLVGSMSLLMILLMFAFFFTPFFLVLVLIVGIKALLSMFSERRLGKVQVSLKPSRVCPGESVMAHVFFPKTERVEVRSISATLEGQEICVSGSGRSRTTHTHSLHKEVVTLKPTGHNEFRAELKVPNTQAYSFNAKNNEISWEIGLNVDVSTWPDWRKAYPILVRPQFSPLASKGLPLKGSKH